jgi:heavy metal sensor kinase
MTITTRLTLFYLLTLAIVLAAFAASAYGLMRTVLYRQLAERSTGALDTLVAAAEIEPDGLDWEPESRKLHVSTEGQQSAWAVFDGAGRRIDGSKASSVELSKFSFPGPDMVQSREEVLLDGQPWWIVQRTIHHPNGALVNSRSARGNPRYGTLVFTTAWPIAPLQETLNMLLYSVVGGSLAVWLLAAAAGRWLSRRALAPLTRMANAVRGITEHDLGERLPASGPHDELDELAVSFNGLMTRLQESFERQKRFTGEASHQLRTPLSVMLGQMEVALRRDRLADDYRHALQTAHAQAERLRGIVEALLFLSRADAEAGAPKPEPLELSCWLQEHLRVFEGTPRYEALRVDLNCSGPCWVSAQRVLLEQSIDNLVDNACKYSPPGTKVLLSLDADGSEARLAIKDLGCGISQEDQAHVFEPFFRSAEARRLGIGGLGLGLAVTARIVSALGGRVDVVSQPGKGSEFTVHLKLLPSSGGRENSESKKCENGQAGEGDATTAETLPVLE